MTEQTFIDLGFDKITISAEESGDPYDCHYYRKKIGEILLLTNTDDEAREEGWWASIFEFDSLKIKGTGDLEELVKILELNIE